MKFILLIFFILIFVLCFIQGWRKGFFSRLLSFIFLFVSILFISQINRFVLPWLSSLSISVWIPYLSYVISFLTIWIISLVIQFIIQLIFLKKKKYWLSRLLGFLISGAEAVIWLWLWFTVLSYQTWFDLFNYLPPIVYNILQRLDQFFQLLFLFKTNS